MNAESESQEWGGRKKIFLGTHAHGTASKRRCLRNGNANVMRSAVYPALSAGMITYSGSFRLAANDKPIGQFVSRFELHQRIGHLYGYVLPMIRSIGFTVGSAQEFARHAFNDVL